MTRSSLIAASVLTLLTSSTAFAAEQTVTLAVKNMYCAACSLTVKASLETVSGVQKAVVSYKEKSAVVTYDDALIDVKALVAATTNAGYPSAPKN